MNESQPKRDLKQYIPSGVIPRAGLNPTERIPEPSAVNPGGSLPSRPTASSAYPLPGAFHGQPSLIQRSFPTLATTPDVTTSNSSVLDLQTRSSRDSTAVPTTMKGDMSNMSRVPRPSPSPITASTQQAQITSSMTTTSTSSHLTRPSVNMENGWSRGPGTVPLRTNPAVSPTSAINSGTAPPLREGQKSLCPDLVYPCSPIPITYHTPLSLHVSEPTASSSSSLGFTLQGLPYVQGGAIPTAFTPLVSHPPLRVSSPSSISSGTPSTFPLSSSASGIGFIKAADILLPPTAAPSPVLIGDDILIVAFVPGANTSSSTSSSLSRSRDDARTSSKQGKLFYLAYDHASGTVGCVTSYAPETPSPSTSAFSHKPWVGRISTNCVWTVTSPLHDPSYPPSTTALTPSSSASSSEASVVCAGSKILAGSQIAFRTQYGMYLTSAISGSRIALAALENTETSSSIPINQHSSRGRSRLPFVLAAPSPHLNVHGITKSATQLFTVSLPSLAPRVPWYTSRRVQHALSLPLSLPLQPAYGAALPLPIATTLPLSVTFGTPVSYSSSSTTTTTPLPAISFSNLSLAPHSLQQHSSSYSPEGPRVHIGNEWFSLQTDPALVSPDPASSTLASSHPSLVHSPTTNDMVGKLPPPIDRFLSLPMPAQEALLLDEYLSALLGIPGDLILLDTSSPHQPLDSPITPLQSSTTSQEPPQYGTFVIHPTLVHHPLATPLRRLLSLCTDHLRIQTFTALRHSTFQAGTIAHAFASSLRVILNEYYVLVSQLENMFRGTSGLSLLRLHHYLQFILPAFQRIAQVLIAADTGIADPLPSLSSQLPSAVSTSSISSTSSTSSTTSTVSPSATTDWSTYPRLAASGGRLLSLLHNHVLEEGDPTVRTMLLKLTRAAASPYLQMLTDWVAKGVLTDPYQEFFIKRVRRSPLSSSTSATLSNTHNRSSNHLDLVNDEIGYEVDTSRLPSFLSSVAYKALHAGRAIIIMKDCIKRFGIVSQGSSLESERVTETGTNLSTIQHPPLSPVLATSPMRRGSVVTVSTYQSPGSRSVAPLQNNQQISYPIEHYHLGSPGVSTSLASPLLKSSSSDVDPAYGFNLLPLVYSDSTRELIEAISTAYTRASLRVVGMLLHDVDIIGRLRSVKRYYFLLQGDLIEHFMDIAGPELSKSPADVSIPKLTSLLELAIRNSRAADDRYKDDVSCTLEWIGTPNKSSSDHGSSSDNPPQVNLANLKGFDLFTLTYQADWPVSLVLSPLVLHKYAFIFRSLFFAKHVARHLGSAFLALQSFKTATVTKALALSNALRHRMTHFVGSILHYITTQVLEPNWFAFEQQLKECTTVDDIADLHNAFLDKCLRECLLASPDLWSLLSKVLKYCLLFADNLQRFHKSIEMSSEELEAALHITLKRKQAVLERQIAANGGDASTTSSLSLPSSTNASSNASPQVLGSTLRRTSMASQESKTGVTLTESEIRRVRMKLHSAKVAEGVLQRNYQSMVKDFSDRFDEKLRKFVHHLRERSATQHDHHLANLLTRLDFNDFYSSYFQQTS